MANHSHTEIIKYSPFGMTGPACVKIHCHRREMYGMLNTSEETLIKSVFLRNPPEDARKCVKEGASRCTFRAGNAFISVSLNRTESRGSGMNDPFVKLDLHGMTQEQARKAIDKALASAGPQVYQLQLVHGYHRGTSLRTMIRDWYGYEPKVRRIIPGDNPGITVLVLKELY